MSRALRPESQATTVEVVEAHPDVDVRGPEDCWPWLGAAWPVPEDVVAGVSTCEGGSSCCNPAHRRVVRKLTDEALRALLVDAGKGMSYRRLAETYGISVARVGQLVRRDRARREASCLR